jgi:hypothetical protein
VSTHFNSRSPKVDQETNFDSGGLQVVDDLCLVFWDERSDRFDLNQDTTLYKDVGNECPDLVSPKLDLDGNVVLHVEAVVSQSNQQRMVIDALEKAGAELIAHFKAHADDSARQLLVQPATRFAPRENQRKHGGSIESPRPKWRKPKPKIIRHERALGSSAPILFIFLSWCAVKTTGNAASESLARGDVGAPR